MGTVERIREIMNVRQLVCSGNVRRMQDRWRKRMLEWKPVEKRECEYNKIHCGDNEDNAVQFRVLMGQQTSVEDGPREQ
jgi:hypothetical protein